MAEAPKAAVIPDTVTVPTESETAETGFEVGVEESATGRVFTEEDVERIRTQEKDKLYKRLEDSDGRVKSLEGKLSVLVDENAEAKTLAEKLAQVEADALKQREEEELSAKELIARRETEFNEKINTVEAEWKERLSKIEEERETQDAMLEKERRLRELNEYLIRTMQQEEEFIIPELRDLVSGSTEEEIDISIAVLKDRSSAILESIQQSANSGLRGSPVTAPPVGPMETQADHQTLSAEDIRNMPMDQYMQMRDRLLKARPSQSRF
tara:strand:- start:752 stop:1555 length:804 start_codon:yes stop_codon:yes gene_type:complete